MDLVYGAFSWRWTHRHAPRTARLVCTMAPISQTRIWRSERPPVCKGPQGAAFALCLPPSCSLFQTWGAGSRLPGPGPAPPPPTAAPRQRERGRAGSARGEGTWSQGMNGCLGDTGGAADEERGGEGAHRQPKQPARLGPVFNPQNFPSASGALAARATRGRMLGKINTGSVATPLRARPAILRAPASGEKGSPSLRGLGRAGWRLPAACCLWLCGWGPAGVHLPPGPGGRGPRAGPTRPGPPWLTPRFRP